IPTHGMCVAIAGAMSDCFKLSARDYGLTASPMFHTSGMSVFSNCLFVGCPQYMLEKWDVAEFARVLQDERITFMHLIATIIFDIAHAPEEMFRHDKSAMRFVWGGGHSPDPSVFDAFERRMGGLLLQGYSRTEGGLSYNPLDRARRRFDAHGFQIGRASCRERGENGVGVR